MAILLHHRRPSLEGPISAAGPGGRRPSERNAQYAHPSCYSNSRHVSHSTPYTRDCNDSRICGGGARVWARRCWVPYLLVDWYFTSPDLKGATRGIVSSHSPQATAGSRHYVSLLMNRSGCVCDGDNPEGTEYRHRVLPSLPVSHLNPVLLADAQIRE